jgi:hypothetical protein
MAKGSYWREAAIPNIGCLRCRLGTDNNGRRRAPSAGLYLSAKSLRREMARGPRFEIFPPRG